MIELKTPEAPATAKQLWLLHILSGEDTRGLTLTMQQASERIAGLKGKQGTKPKAKAQGQYYLMTRPRGKWLAYHYHDTTKHLRGIIKSNSYYYDQRPWAIVWATTVFWARRLIEQYLDGKLPQRKLTGKTGTVYAELIEDTFERKGG